MSICPEPDICSLYVDGELCKDKIADFEQHVQVCSECRNNIKAYQRLKEYISYNVVPEFDLKQSFEKMLLKQSVKKTCLIYKLFYSWKKNKIFFNSFVAMFAFALILISAISIRSVINLADSDTTFKPIIPIAYESNLNIKLDNLTFSTMNVPFHSEIKMKDRTYKNMVNTFNGFTNLYSNLDHSEKYLCSNRMSIMNRNVIVNYSADIPFYRSLNKK